MATGSPGAAEEPAAAPSTWKAHLMLFLLLGGLIGGAWLLRPVEQDGTRLQVGGVALPHLCWVRRVTHRPCPGCGLTRSWVAAADAQWRRSYAYHRLGIPVLAVVALHALRHGLWLVLPRARRRLDRLGPKLDWLLIPLVVLLLVNGVWVFVAPPPGVV